MRSHVVLVLVLGAGIAAADPARVTIAHDALWPTREKPITVRIANGAWTKLAAGKTAGPIPIAVPARGKAVPIDVRAPAGRAPFRRWAVVLPDLRYKLAGNPCATYGFAIDDDVERVGATTVAIDATALPARMFPLVVSTDATEDDDELGAEATLEAPAVARPVELPVSAMCPDSGAPLVVYSKGTRKRLLDISLIGHPGGAHVVKLARGGAFTVTVDPDR